MLNNSPYVHPSIYLFLYLSIYLSRYTYMYLDRYRHLNPVQILGTVVPAFNRGARVKGVTSTRAAKHAHRTTH